MTRKKLITFFVVLVLVIAGYATLSYFQSFKTAYINIPRRGVSVTVYNAGKKQVGSLNQSGKLSLQAGTYTMIPGGTHISTSPLTLKVGNQGVYATVDPGYSNDYLGQLLTDQLSTIQSVISSQYGSILDGFTLNTGSLYAYGDWYATTLAQHSPGPGANGDVYRLVMQKVDGNWTIAAAPAITISALDYPRIPHAVLTNIDAQTGF